MTDSVCFSYQELFQRLTQESSVPLTLDIYNWYQYMQAHHPVYFDTTRASPSGDANANFLTDPFRQFSYGTWTALPVLYFFHEVRGSRSQDRHQPQDSMAALACWQNTTEANR